jgi:hypothetical protein
MAQRIVAYVSCPIRHRSIRKILDEYRMQYRHDGGVQALAPWLLYAEVSGAPAAFAYRQEWHARDLRRRNNRVCKYDELHLWGDEIDEGVELDIRGALKRGKKIIVKSERMKCLLEAFLRTLSPKLASLPMALAA